MNAGTGANDLKLASIRLFTEIVAGGAPPWPAEPSAMRLVERIARKMPSSTVTCSFKDGGLIRTVCSTPGPGSDIGRRSVANAVIADVDMSSHHVTVLGNGAGQAAILAHALHTHIVDLGAGIFIEDTWRMSTRESGSPPAFIDVTPHYRNPSRPGRAPSYLHLDDPGFVLGVISWLRENRRIVRMDGMTGFSMGAGEGVPTCMFALGRPSPCHGDDEGRRAVAVVLLSSARAKSTVGDADGPILKAIEELTGGLVE